ncbi:hypothetical protein U0070_022171 [Myodes glareolus]|uniref:Ku C-terminal domain-containing protein n=1 Tax=Myodes glareolus TaxID=447135 RepID=A0AAW0IP85_MYOGA
MFRSSLQLISHIEQFVDTNEVLYFLKSMECIKAFREEAIQVLAALTSFCPNSCQRAEASSTPTKKPGFRKHYSHCEQYDGVTLITKDESPGSSVTAEEATEFLAPKGKAKEGAAGLEEGGDVDDLLDMI